LGDSPAEHYDFETDGELSWYAREVVEGANRVYTVGFLDESLEVITECYGTVNIVDPRSPYLGSFTRQHISEEWDGHIVHEDLCGGEWDISSDARYHICSPFCEVTALQTPIIILHTTDEDTINLYCNWEEEDPQSLTTSPFRR
jgi:hypothetical protein